MKRILYYLTLVLAYQGYTQEPHFVVDSDIQNFWNAYDQIVLTKDRANQLELINDLYIEKGTPGLHGIMQARQYTADMYVDAINNFPLFWKSVRQNTLRSGQFTVDLEAGIERLRVLYPLKPAKIYFTIGAFMTGGTTLNDMVLIGSEVTMTDKNTVTHEFPEGLSHLRGHFDSDPIKNLVFLNTHEYVHTQQSGTIGNSVMMQAVIEGAAEFVAELALQKPSPNLSVNYGKAHSIAVRDAFIQDMFSPNFDNWFYNDTNNKFGQRDLGYYAGYAICKTFYDKANDKKEAIRQMIELNYSNYYELSKFVDSSSFFEKAVNEYLSDYEKAQPTVVAIKEFKNGARDVDSTIKTMSIVFSAPMDTRYRNMRLGPLGESNLIHVTGAKGWSEDGRTLTYEIDLTPGHRQQITLWHQFRSGTGQHLEPYLIDITTSL